MNGSTAISPAVDWLTWPLKLTELAAQTVQAAALKIAPDALAQSINPGWSLYINSNNSSAPETEQSVLAHHSYGRQLGRLLDIVDLLVDDLEARQASLSGNERIEDFRRLQADIAEIKTKAAERRLERMEADLELLRRSNDPAYGKLKERVRDLARA